MRCEAEPSRHVFRSGVQRGSLAWWSHLFSLFAELFPDRSPGG